MIFIGTLNEQKGIQYLVKIISKIIDAYPTIEIIIVGVGPYQILVNNLIKEYPENIQYFEQLPHSEVAKTLARTWVALSTSITLKNSSEQTAGFLLEAMACGNGIVAFNSGGISRFVEDGINGLLSDEKNIDKYVNNISLLLKDKNGLHKMQKNNRQKAVQFYDAKSNVKKLEQLLVKKLST
ncbi:MAG: Glycosyl transferase, group 1 family protein [Berkelbacteria bacterium GW2011_GWA2_35_9]|uniref:Glycosyl transferase, group 1 family protein n=1 Tax=Berkelbacteria bacterium GW2011_GWA2_35_9 TaxID=1618333 RepID=A0A0G0D323_9BACT|nr:MAG: Glycosyl transferase, group 1 family protein [Berkelbacteria bacterium GW2011_GWA2_35_9]